MSIADYIRDTRGELKHVSWPTRKQAIVFTVLTIILSVVLALYLGFFDFLFSLGLEQIIAK
jgi:preprotein translocase SecE subunit